MLVTLVKLVTLGILALCHLADAGCPQQHPNTWKSEPGNGLSNVSRHLKAWGPSDVAAESLLLGSVVNVRHMMLSSN